MLIQCTESMENRFDIGTRVKWSIRGFILRGLFIERLDDQFSEVRCYEKNGQRCVCNINVCNSLLEPDN